MRDLLTRTVVGIFFASKAAFVAFLSRLIDTKDVLMRSKNGRCSVFVLPFPDSRSSFLSAYLVRYTRACSVKPVSWLKDVAEDFASKQTDIESSCSADLGDEIEMLITSNVAGF